MAGEAAYAVFLVAWFPAIFKQIWSFYIRVLEQMGGGRLDPDLNFVRRLNPSFTPGSALGYMTCLGLLAMLLATLGSLGPSGTLPALATDDVVHPRQQPPFALSPWSNLFKVILTTMAFGLELKFNEPPADSWMTPFKTYGGLAFKYCMVGLAINSWACDIMKFYAAASDEHIGPILGLALVWVTSSNYGNAKAVWTKLAVQSPTTAFRLRLNYPYIAFFGELGIPSTVGGASWLPAVQQVYAFILLPYVLLENLFLLPSILLVIVGSYKFFGDFIPVNILSLTVVFTPYPTLVLVGVLKRMSVNVMWKGCIEGGLPHTASLSPMKIEREVLECGDFLRTLVPLWTAQGGTLPRGAKVRIAGIDEDGDTMWLDFGRCERDLFCATPIQEWPFVFTKDLEQELPPTRSRLANFLFPIPPPVLFEKSDSKALLEKTLRLTKGLKEQLADEGVASVCAANALQTTTSRGDGTLDDAYIAIVARTLVSMNSVIYTQIIVLCAVNALSLGFAAGSFWQGLEAAPAQTLGSRTFQDYALSLRSIAQKDWEKANSGSAYVNQLWALL